MPKIKGPKNGHLFAKFDGKSIQGKNTTEQKCLVLISVTGNEYCSGQYFKAIFQNAIQLFQHTTFLIVDSPQYFNLLAKNFNTEVNNENECKLLAKKMGEDWWLENVQHILNILPEDMSAHVSNINNESYSVLEKIKFFNISAEKHQIACDFITWNEWIQKTSLYETPAYLQAKEKFQTEGTLKKALEKSTQEYAKRKSKKNEVEYAHFASYSAQFLMEESIGIYIGGNKLAYDYVAYAGDQLEVLKASQSSFVNSENSSLLSWLNINFQRRNQAIDSLTSPCPRINPIEEALPETEKNSVTISQTDIAQTLTLLTQDIQNIIPPEEMTERFEYYQGILAGFIGMMYTYQQIYHTKPTTMQTQQMQKALKENLPAIHANINLFFHNKNTSAISTNNDTQLIKPEYPLNDNPSSTRFSV